MTDLDLDALERHEMRGGSPDSVRLALIAEVRANRFALSSSGLVEQNAALIRRLEEAEFPRNLGRASDYDRVDLDALEGDWLEGRWAQRDALIAELRAARKIVNAASSAMTRIQAFGDFSDEEAEELGLGILSDALAEVGK